MAVFIASAFFLSAPAAEPPITALAFSPDGSSLVACSQVGVAVYSWPELDLQATHKVSSPNLHDLAFSPSGDRLAVAGGIPAENGTVEILAWPDGESLKTLDGHLDAVMSVCWLDASTLATASLDHTVSIWNTDSGKTIHRCLGHSRGVTSLEHLRDQAVLVSASLDQSIRVWNSATGELIRSLAIHVKPVSRVVVRPASDGLPMIASASDDRTVRFWQPTIGRMVRFARLPAQPRDIAWVSDGTQILAGCNDGVVYWVNPETVEVTGELRVMDQSDQRVQALAIHPTDGSAVAGGTDGRLQRFQARYQP